MQLGQSFFKSLALQQGPRKAGTMREIHTGAKKKKGAEGA
jgi:hypothetical protein